MNCRLKSYLPHLHQKQHQSHALPSLMSLPGPLHMSDLGQDDLHQSRAVEHS
jgi:hypothetical protein